MADRRQQEKKGRELTQRTQRFWRAQRTKGMGRMPKRRRTAKTLSEVEREERRKTGKWENRETDREQSRRVYHFGKGSPPPPY
jgi:hypothetical protein